MRPFLRALINMNVDVLIMKNIKFLDKTEGKNSE